MANEDRLEEAKEYFEKAGHSFSVRHFYGILIQEMELLRIKNETLDCLADINLKGPDVRVADPKEVRAKLIRQQQRKIATLTKASEASSQTVKELEAERDELKVEAKRWSNDMGDRMDENATLKQELKASQEKVGEWEYAFMENDWRRK